MAAVATAVGVSVPTVRKWVRRSRAAGLAVLQDRSSWPRRNPRQLSRAWRRQILWLRRQRCSSLRIAAHLALPLSTVVATQRRLGLNRLSRLTPRPPVVRYERARPGELLHVDTKKLDRIGRVGHRIHGDRRRRVPGIGWDVLHMAIDDATRLTYAEVLADECSATVASFVERAVVWFADRGIAVERVMTDNGSGYVGRWFQRLVARLAVRHLRTRPYTPRTNGKAERFTLPALLQHGAPP